MPSCRSSPRLGSLYGMHCPLCLAKVAEKVAFTSAGNLSRLFRQHYGVSFQANLQKLGLEKAAELLKTRSSPCPAWPGASGTRMSRASASISNATKVARRARGGSGDQTRRPISASLASLSFHATSCGSRFDSAASAAVTPAASPIATALPVTR